MVSLSEVRNGSSRSGRARLLVAQLQAVERRVAPTLAQEFVVPTGLGHAAILDDEDAIGVDHRVQAVSNHDRGLPLVKVLESALQLALEFGLERGSALVMQDTRCDL